MKRIGKRIGSIIPMENVDPHTGSFLDYGVIVGWQNRDGNPCQRKDALYVIAEPSGRKVNDWSKWHEQNVGKLITLSDFEANKDE